MEGFHLSRALDALEFLGEIQELPEYYAVMRDLAIICQQRADLAREIMERTA